MSEEILKALMQLFAIISKQGDGGDSNHDTYVKEFLLSQISIDRYGQYFDQYLEYKNKQTNRGDGKKTSVKDSVRTLAICKRINKTLSQKQKTVVLVRICEFIYKSNEDLGLRFEIVETIGSVFKIDKGEFTKIIAFSSAVKLDEIIDNTEIQIHLDKKLHNVDHVTRIFNKNGLTSILLFCHLDSAKIILFRFLGDENFQLNGLSISHLKTHVLTDGATLRTSKGSIFFNEILNNFRKENKIENISFQANIPVHKFKGGKIALNGIQLSEESGTLFGIMGGSGAGKTTLLNILSGLEPSNEAIIKFNGHSIQSEEARANIGYIPQDDLLIEELTVYQNLYYNSKLINASGNEHEIKKGIAKVLNDLGLWEIRNIVVGNALNKKISGGQRKRLNIALELIREPLVLFVDEPTSGLSSKDSENVMDLLKLLSQSGKLIFVVIHQPSSEIFKLFDKLMILDVGGLPVYYGNPIESVIYFKTITNQINQEIGECGLCGNVNPEQIFDTLEAKELDEFGKYTNIRKIDAPKWNEFYKEKLAPSKTEKIKDFSKLVKIKTPNLIKQFLVFFTRDLLARLGDKQYMLIAILEAPFLALILSLIIRNSSDNVDGYKLGLNQNIPAYFFMLIIMALFIGLTVSAEEIFKDQRILKREKFLRLSRFSYLSSKVSYLVTLSTIQSFLLCLVGNLIIGFGFDNFIYYWLMIFSIFVFGNLIGLILSSSFKSIVTIYIIIPLIIIPQMVLGGAMFKFENLNKVIGGGHKPPVISKLMVSMWGYEGIIVSQFINNKYEQEFYEYDQLLSESSYRTSYLLPFLEDLMNENLYKGKLESAICSDTIINTLNFELSRPSVNEINGLDFTTHTINDAFETIALLDKHYQETYNQVVKLKDQKMAELVSVMGIDGLTDFKNRYFNEDINEIVKNGLSSEKYYIENSLVHQYYDQIFLRDQLLPSYSENPHMFVPKKIIMGTVLPTFWYNFIVIWVFNFILFALLYFNIIKRILSIF